MFVIFIYFFYPNISVTVDEDGEHTLKRAKNGSNLNFHLFCLKLLNYEIYNENLFCPAGKPIFVVSKTWNEGFIS